MYTALQTAKLINEKKISCKEVVQEALSKAYESKDKLNAFICIDKENALKQADYYDKNVDKFLNSSILFGLPIAVKDNILTKGIQTTAASKILDGFVPSYSATVVDKLNKAGLIVIGKTNMDEFGMGSTSENSFYGRVHNPYDVMHVSGGSSGGSCAYVAGGKSLLALGSDTGGSVRQPACFCGVVGIKPTYSTVSRNGLIAYASSFDTIGSIGGNVADSTALLDIISGYDENDATSKKIDRYDYMSALSTDIKGKKIGIVKEFVSDKTDKSIISAMHNVKEVLEKKGAIVSECSMKFTKESLQAYYIIACAQASSNLERYDGVKYGYRSSEYNGLHDMYKKTRGEGLGLEVKRRIMLGSFVLSSGYYDDYYLKALKIRRLVSMEYDRLFKEYDALLCPCSNGVAPKVNALQTPLEMYKSDICTVGVNLVGNCAIAFNCGKNEKGLPIGVQLIGDKFAEKKIINIAYAYSKEIGKED